MRGVSNFTNRFNYFWAIGWGIFLAVIFMGGIITPAGGAYTSQYFGVTALVLETCTVSIPTAGPVSNSTICNSTAASMLASQITVNLMHTGDDGRDLLTVEF